MITYDEALSKAKELKKDIDFCVEYSDAYMFGLKSEENEIGGNPCIILKETGKAINIVEYFDEYDAKEIKRFEV